MAGKIKLIFLFSLFLNIISAQSDSSKKHRHEVGADITGFVKHFLNFSENSYYAPTYYISYRYHFKKSNIRFGIGGMYTQNFSYPYIINNEEKVFENTSSDFSFRVGYERAVTLSPRWQTFYGIDLRPSFVETKNEIDYQNGGYINGSVSTSQVYGIAPLLGFRYKISNRVSILTEMSFNYNLQKLNNQKTFLSLDNNLYPSIPNGKKVSTKSLSASFSQPIFLVLAVDL